MPLEIVDNLMFRIREHCLQHSIENFDLILHGGEPLLAGKLFFKYFKEKAEEVLKDITNVSLGIQTNAVLLDREWCEWLGQLGYGVGISLDGPKKINDVFRLDHAGRGSYDAIVQGIKNAQSSAHLKNPGVLCVINVNTDPLEIYNHFKSLKVNGCSFLLPDANYDHFPPGAKYFVSETPYADWLIKLFDLWFYEEPQEAIDIVYFRLIMENILGSEAGSDNINNNENEILVVETNGGIESVDVLKICGDGFTKSEASVLTHSFDEAMVTPLAKLYRFSGTMLCKKCLVCPINETCGGGYVPHRFSYINGFNNPSVYCNDLMKLITHIQNRVLENLPEDILVESGVKKISYKEVQQIIETNIHKVNEPDYIHELMVNK